MEDLGGKAAMEKESRQRPPVAALWLLWGTDGGVRGAQVGAVSLSVQPTRCQQVLRNVKWGTEKRSSWTLVIPAMTVAVTYRNVTVGGILMISLWAPWLGCQTQRQWQSLEWV